MSDSDSDDVYFPIYKCIPILDGDNSVHWQIAVQWYLGRAVAVQVMLGEEKEPYRVNIEPRVPARDGDFAGTYAPRAAVGQYAATSVTNKDLTAAQMASWEAWGVKERSARRALIMTIQPAFADFLKDKWSSHDVYKSIELAYNVQSASLRAKVFHRITALKLPQCATQEQMLSHLQSYTDLEAELELAGGECPEWLKCEMFLRSFSCDLEPLQHFFHMEDNAACTWSTLIGAYISRASGRDSEEDRHARNDHDIIRHVIQPAGNASGRWRERRRERNNITCDWCGKRGHDVEVCRRKAAGQPSRFEMQVTRQSRLQ